ncbi:hypothetical protein CR513_11671, partial [Mucuna pruriens]
MEDNETIDLMFGTFQTIIDNLRSLDKTYDDYDHMEELWGTLKMKGNRKEIKENKPNIHCSTSKELSKPSRTNPKGPKKTWVPKTMIIPVVDVLNNKKETPIMVPRY